MNLSMVADDVTGGRNVLLRDIVEEWRKTEMRE
jgi:hypothetical protein